MSVNKYLASVIPCNLLVFRTAFEIRVKKVVKYVILQWLWECPHLTGSDEIQEFNSTKLHL